MLCFITSCAYAAGVVLIDLYMSIINREQPYMKPWLDMKCFSSQAKNIMLLCYAIIFKMLIWRLQTEIKAFRKRIQAIEALNPKDYTSIINAHALCAAFMVFSRTSLLHLLRCCFFAL
jgi:hypothetical protein